MTAVNWAERRAVLFDLDGVVTPTATVHLRAWEVMFNEFLASHDPTQPPFTTADYHAYVDGKPRYDGVRSFLASRDIALSEEEVIELGDRKNVAFNQVLEAEGVEPYPGSVLLLDHLGALGVPMAVVSSSANAVPVLTRTGLLGRFAAVVDGVVAKAESLPGKPHPDTFLYGARLLGASAAESVVLEDAVSGVAAGRAGEFGLVIGVDRGAGVPALTEAGADVVVADLAELV
ncbi:HAD family hydrolase [Nocardioides sp.]|uniref:HAD family hydrolase n=1 Tax=Nocardioides sp. TaxID=35761 RepID=UPI0039E42512